MTLYDEILHSLLLSYRHHINAPTSHLGFEASVAYLTKDTTKFDVHLMLRWNIDGGIDGDLIYSASKFGRDTMCRFADEYVHMATQVATNDMSQVPVLELPMVLPKDLDLARNVWNESCPQVPFPPPTSVPKTVMAAMHHHSNAVAVQESGGRAYSYTELLSSIKQLSGAIRKVSSGKPNPRVGLLFKPGYQMYSALLAVLACGGVVVPIDSSHTPINRAKFMLEDSETDIVVYDEANGDFSLQVREQLEGRASSFFKYNEIVAMKVPPLDENEEYANAENLAYILYTSGTSGMPKGVLISVRLSSAFIFLSS